MKKLLMLISLVSVSLPAFAACPNLAGEFTCSNGSQLKISQKIETSKVTSYVVQGLLNGDLAMITDGTPHEVEGATITSSCKNNILQVRMDHDRGSLDFNFSIQGKLLKIRSTVQGDITCQ